MFFLPSVLWRCWLGGRKGIRPVKNERWGAGVVICLEWGADLHMSQLMPLPLTVSCFSKIQIGFTFLVPAHLGIPEKGPLNGCVCVCVFYNTESVGERVVYIGQHLVNFCCFWLAVGTVFLLLLHIVHYFSYFFCFQYLFFFIPMLIWNLCMCFSFHCIFCHRYCSFQF